MSRRLVLAGALLSVSSALALRAGQSPSPQVQTPVFRTESAFVRVDVYPSKDGRIVRGLTRRDFQLFEDGKPQVIETFDYVDFPTFASEEERRDPATKEEGDAMAADPRNRVFVIYLDTFNISIPESHDSRAPLIAMLDRTIGPSDVFGVLTPRQTYADLVFGRKVRGTEDALARNWTWGESERPEWDETAQMLQACYRGRMKEGPLAELIARERLDRTLGRLRELVDYLGRLRQERKNLIMFSHGWDLAGPAEYLMTAIEGTPRAPQPTVSLGGKLTLGDRSRGELAASTCESERVRLANADFRDRFRELLDAAKRANVSFYPVNPAGLSADTGVSTTGGGPIQVQQVEQRRNGMETAVDHLRELAVTTDGIAVVDTNDLRNAMMKITDSLSAYYLLGYYPTNSKQDGSVRMITVKGPAGLDVKARRQYRAANGKEEVARRAAVSATSAGVSAGVGATNSDLDAAFESLARISASRADMTGRAGMITGSELAVVAEASQPVAADVEIQVMLNDAAGNTVATGRGRIVAGARAVSVRLPVAPGSKGPWQAVMRVTSGQLRGGETLPVEMPEGLLGEPQITRVEGASASPVASPVFSQRERLRVAWRTREPVDLVRQEARVLDRRGQPLTVDATVSATTSVSGTIIGVDVNLAPLAPGDYVLELIVAAGSSPSRQLLAFRVIQ